MGRKRMLGMAMVMQGDSKGIGDNNSKRDNGGVG